MVLMLLAPAFAGVPSDATSTPETRKVEVTGEYALWNLQQHNFLLGAEHPLDDTALTVQNLRVRAAAGKSTYGVVARFDVAQGWWGADNDPSSGYAVTTATDGIVTGARAYNDDGLFRGKDGFYGVHFDQAYAWASFGKVEVRAGRQYLSVGNRLVLDDDLNGVTAIVQPQGKVRAEVFAAKMAEGRDALTLPTSAVISDVDDSSDANLYGAKLRYVTPTLNAEIFGLHFSDTIADDWSLLAQGLGYARPRFAAQPTRLEAFGLAADGKVADRLSWRIEGDFLTGEDGIDNANHAAGALDMNDGTLSGWNALADLKYAFAGRIPADVGFLAGMGSGDDEPMGGGGNVNKVSTMGLWSMTNVWEDSVMPNGEGISPQGLGSPVSRGYRELENTTAAQLRAGFKPVSALRLEASGTWLRATAPVHGVDGATGDPSGTTSQDLGWEADVNAIVSLRDDAVYGRILGGWFQPGEGASLVITGAEGHLDPAWEIKTEAGVKF